MAPASKADERDERSESSNLSLSVVIGAAKAPDPPGPALAGPIATACGSLRGPRAAPGIRPTAALEVAGDFDDDFAEIFVGFHMGVGFGHAVQGVDGVDFGAEFSAFEHRE
jgi:hypothetical protein